MDLRLAVRDRNGQIPARQVNRESFFQPRDTSAYCLERSRFVLPAQGGLHRPVIPLIQKHCYPLGLWLDRSNILVCHQQQELAAPTCGHCYPVEEP